jgi:hypothetical protein
VQNPSDQRQIIFPLVVFLNVSLKAPSPGRGAGISYALFGAEGSILLPQTFGEMANWNPHVHALITDTCWNMEGNCYPMPEIDTADLQGIEKLFAGLVFKMLLKEGMISEKLVKNMNSWKHSGFRDLPGTSSSMVMLVSAFTAVLPYKQMTRIPARASANTYQELHSRLKG